jgi:two-component system, sensor histidine kinase and response regulator
MDDYLPKPFYKDGLVAMLNRWLIQGGDQMKPDSQPTENQKEGGAATFDGPTKCDRPQESEGSTCPGPHQHAQAETARGPVVDRSVLDAIRELQREGTPDLVGKLINLYLADASDTLKALRSALSTKNTQGTFRLAHKLKSSSANVGALQLSALFKNLEALGRQNEVEGADAIFADIEKEWDAVRRTLEAQVQPAPTAQQS